MDDSTAKIIVGLIGLFGTILGIMAGYIGRTRKEAINDAKREQEQQDLFSRIFAEMESIKHKLDQHNHYAEKFGEIEKSIVAIKKDVEYIRKEKK